MSTTYDLQQALKEILLDQSGARERLLTDLQRYKGKQKLLRIESHQDIVLTKDKLWGKKGQTVCEMVLLVTIPERGSSHICSELLRWKPIPKEQAKKLERLSPEELEKIFTMSNGKWVLRPGMNRAAICALRIEEAPDGRMRIVD